jgi:FkbM family methyltransferase
MNINTLFDKCMAQFNTNEKVNFVQIGCRHGLDHCTKHLKTNKYNSYLFEPIPHWYNELQNNYKECNKVNTYNHAISEKNDSIQMYWVDPKKHGNKVPDWYYGHSSINYDNAPGHNWGIENSSDILTVQSKTFDTVVKEYGIDKIDIYVSDTEGYDINILRQVDFERFSPKLMHIESNKIKDDDMEYLKNILSKYDYKYANSFQDPRLTSNVNILLNPSVDLIAWRLPITI